MITIRGHKHTGGARGLDDALQLLHNGTEGREAEVGGGLPMLIAVAKALWRGKQVGTVLHVFTSPNLTWGKDDKCNIICHRDMFVIIDS